MVDDDGENSIVVDPGANATVGLADLEPVSELGPGDVLLVQGELPHACRGRRDRAGRRGRRPRGAQPRAVHRPAGRRGRAWPTRWSSTRRSTGRCSWRRRSSRSWAGPRARRARCSSPAARAVRPGSDIDAARDRRRRRPRSSTRPAPAMPSAGRSPPALAAGLDREAALSAALAAGADAVRRMGAQPG